MDKDQVPGSWAWKTVVVVEIRGRKRGRYLVLGRLSEATVEGVRLLKPSSERVTFYAWENVVDVRLPRDA